MKASLLYLVIVCVFADNDDTMGMVACDDTRRTQDWILSPAVIPGRSDMTVIEDRYGDCIELPLAHGPMGMWALDMAAKSYRWLGDVMEKLAIAIWRGR
jgi:hypothetical protein